MSCDRDRRRVCVMRAKVAPRAALSALCGQVMRWHRWGRWHQSGRWGAMGGADAGFITGAGGVGVHSIWPCGTCGPTGMVRRQPPRRYMTWPESQEFGRAGPNIKHGLGRPCAQVLSPRAPVQSTTRVLLTMHGVRSSRSPRFIGTTIFYEVCLFSIHKLS